MSRGRVGVQGKGVGGVAGGCGNVVHLAVWVGAVLRGGRGSRVAEWRRGGGLGFEVRVGDRDRGRGRDECLVVRVKIRAQVRVRVGFRVMGRSGVSGWGRSIRFRRGVPEIRFRVRVVDGGKVKVVVRVRVSEVCLVQVGLRSSGGAGVWGRGGDDVCVRWIRSV